MYNSEIKIKTKAFNVDIRLKSIVSVATGHSSTGKTFLLKMLDSLKNASKSNIIESNINIDDIIICNKESDIQNLLLNNNCTGKTIFIDRYDYFKSDSLEKFIMSGKNRVVIMSHTFYNRLNLHAESFITINYNKNCRLFYTEELIEHLDEETI